VQYSQLRHEFKTNISSKSVKCLVWGLNKKKHLSMIGSQLHPLCIVIGIDDTCKVVWWMISRVTTTATCCLFSWTGYKSSAILRRLHRSSTHVHSRLWWCGRLTSHLQQRHQCQCI